MKRRFTTILSRLGLALLVTVLLAWPPVAQANLLPFDHDVFDVQHERGVNEIVETIDVCRAIQVEIRWVLIIHRIIAPTNQVLSTTDPLGRTTTFTYDAAGNVLTITDPDNQITRFEYEPTFNRVTKITDALNQITEFTYDPANGNLLTVKDPLNHVTTISYNAFGQPTSVQGPIPSEPPTTFAYDATGNLITTTDPLGNATQRTYDAMGRLLSLTDPRGLVTQFRYDDFNRVTEMKDARQEFLPTTGREEGTA